MKHGITPALAGAFIRRAFAKGYQVRQLEPAQDPKLCLAAYLDGQEICRFEKSGAMRFYQGNPLEKERGELHDLLLGMKQAHDLYADAKPLACDGVEDFRLVCEFGDYLLAAGMDKHNEVRFVTWSYTHGRTGVTMGHYYETNYEGAKRDFAIRAGLVSEREIFSKEDLAVLYAACLYQGRNDGMLSYEGEKKLDDVTQKIQSGIPEMNQLCSTECQNERFKELQDPLMKTWVKPLMEPWAEPLMASPAGSLMQLEIEDLLQSQAEEEDEYGL